MRDSRIGRILDVSLGFTRKNIGKDRVGGGSMVIVLGEWSGLFERRSVAGKYSGVWSSGGSYGCESFHNDCGLGGLASALVDDGMGPLQRVKGDRFHLTIFLKFFCYL